MTVAARIRVRSVVDTAALRHNLARVRALAPGCRVIAVIKANAYGHGLVPAARALAASDAFAVARLEEGLALRDAGFDQRVVLLEGVRSPSSSRRPRQQGFDLMVHSFEQLALLEARRGDDTAARLAEARHRHEPPGFPPGGIPGRVRTAARASAASRSRRSS